MNIGFLFFSSEPVHLIPKDGKSEEIDVGNAKQNREVNVGLSPIL
jgi:hypothetical protein